MTTTTATTHFFGDAERSFKLTPTLVEELERQSGAGIGAIFKRVRDADFRYADLIQTIRLGLIGGGETPQVAASLVKVYALDRPISEILELAIDILATVFVGASKPEGDDK